MGSMFEQRDDSDALKLAERLELERQARHKAEQRQRDLAQGMRLAALSPASVFATCRQLRQLCATVENHELPLGQRVAVVPDLLSPVHRLDQQALATHVQAVLDAQATNSAATELLDALCQQVTYVIDLLEPLVKSANTSYAEIAQLPPTTATTDARDAAPETDLDDPLGVPSCRPTSRRCRSIGLVPGSIGATVKCMCDRGWLQLSGFLPLYDQTTTYAARKFRCTGSSTTCIRTTSSTSVNRSTFNSRARRPNLACASRWFRPDGSVRHLYSTAQYVGATPNAPAYRFGVVLGRHGGLASRSSSEAGPRRLAQVLSAGRMGLWTAWPGTGSGWLDKTTCSLLGIECPGDGYDFADETFINSFHPDDKTDNSRRVSPHARDRRRDSAIPWSIR